MLADQAINFHGGWVCANHKLLKVKSQKKVLIKHKPIHLVWWLGEQGVMPGMLHLCLLSLGPVVHQRTCFAKVLLKIKMHHCDEWLHLPSVKHVLPLLPNQSPVICHVTTKENFAHTCNCIYSLAFLINTFFTTKHIDSSWNTKTLMQTNREHVLISVFCTLNVDFQRFCCLCRYTFSWKMKQTVDFFKTLLFSSQVLNPKKKGKKKKKYQNSGTVIQDFVLLAV